MSIKIRWLDLAVDGEAETAVRENLAMLKLLAMSRNSLERGKFRPVEDVLNHFEKSIEIVGSMK